MKILVPTDGSASSLRASKYAEKLASGYEKCAVISLSVHDPLGLHPVGAKAAVGDDGQDSHESEHKVLRVTPDKTGLAPDAPLAASHVAQEILKIAETGGFDLIVMGAKGRSPLCDLVMGSVAQKVLVGTRLPVTLVK